MRPLLRPPALRLGDTIGVCTPSAPAHTRYRAKYLHGVAELRRLGFEVVEGQLTARATDQGHRAGTAEERAAECNALFADRSVRAILCTIGGNCSASLVPYLDFALIRDNPKIFCGYSDITSLHLAFLRHAGLSTFYGPAVMSSFGEWPVVLDETRDAFLDAVMRHRAGERELVAPARWSRHFRDAAGEAWRTEPRQFEPNTGWRVLRAGQARGPALVANLSTLLANAGTPEFPDLDGVVLFVEDIASSQGVAERRFRHLAALGAFDRVAALVWGKIESFSDEGSPMSVDDLLLEAVGEARCFPVVSNFDCAHTVPMLTLAQGVPVRVEAPEGGVARVVLEGAMVS